MERILTDKMNYLADHTQHDITLLLLWKDAAPLPYPLSPKITIVRLGVPYVRGGATLPLLILRYNSMLHRLRPDITVLTWVIGAVLGAFASKVGRTIYESHQAKHSMRHRWIIDRAARRIDTVVALTREDAAEYSQTRHVCVIPNLTNIRSDRPTDYSQKHCVWAGRLNHVKDLPRLLSVWQRLASQHPDWTLDIYGDGEERQHVESLIRQHGIAGSVVMHGRCDDVREAYLAASIFVLTSKYEGFGIVLIEAMACGLPVVAFDCEYGPRNIISNNSNGRLIPYADDDGMVEALHSLMNSQQLRRSMGTQAYRDSARYQPDNIMSAWIKLFENQHHS